MSQGNTNTPGSAKPIQDRDWLASLSRAALLEEAVRRGELVAEIVGISEERAKNEISAADFDKRLAVLLEGDGWFCADILLKSFRKGDAS
ncbi:hypothetical protein [Brytella acorum]|uniref:Uncharacterized protein n=1 Tax=Brytella acorum TaxID=2959299 RepID=A0AA35V048_9PROT|nr:hypothetical protein [Brytella acorum]CAI9120241.1 hypothetical protein LMG32879_001072 [Brytella acorum]